MLKRVFCSVASLFVFMVCIEVVFCELPSEQVSAMTRIYEIIQNDTSPSFVWNNNLKNSSPCLWQGVFCSPDNSYISNISFTSFSISTSEFLPFLCNITTLESHDVSNNQLSSIPQGFYSVCGKISGLKLLSFSGNKFHGSLPAFNGFTMLEYLDFSGNSFSGEISLQLGGLGSLKSIEFSKNNFSGSIPTNLGKMNILEELLLSDNSFTCEIPLEITKYRNLRVVDLSGNELSGSIPAELGKLIRLETLVLSDNYLSGSIPTSLCNIESHVEVDTRGNSDLMDPREKPSLTPQRKKISDSDFVIAVASGIPVGLLISMLAIFISRRYNRMHGHLSPPNSIHSSTIDFKKAMEAVADPSNITLKARFSTFYKAIMPSGTTYLVKKVKHSNKILQFPRHGELLEDLEVVGSLSNSNVMIPIAYVLTVHEAYLFYVFVRGTLYDMLHHRMGNTLEWASRYNIAVGVAQGLSYLHECSSGPIILLDLCSKSILLKSQDEPQISDIELCNLIHPSKTTGINVGSVGYMPPEYGSTKRMTAAGNVYSLGVVLLELLTGKPAVSGETQLVKWVSSRCKQRNKWHEILDSNVGIRNQMLAVLEVALACISTSPEIRPNTVTVVQMLLSSRLHS